MEKRAVRLGQNAEGPIKLKISRREDNMNKQITGIILILAVLIMIPLQGYAATPKETVESGVNKLLATLGDPAFKAQTKDA